MKVIDSKVGEIWVGYHPKVGPVIFNPRSQRGLEQDRVRLYKLDEKCSGTFIKEIVRSNLVVPDGALWFRIEPAVAGYVAAFARRRRITHCFNCKRHLDSVDFSLCESCGWIRCSCGACGCSYNGK